jgi:TonB family protein
MWSMTCSRATRIQLRRARRHAPLVWLAAAGLASTLALAQSPPLPVTEPASPPEASAPAPQDPVAASEAQVKSVEAEVGRNTLRTAEAYFDLAEAKRAAGERDEAATSYLAAIDIYRAVDGGFTPLAIGPLTSLGDNYHEAGEYLSAVSAYGEARTISRRAYGLTNEGQVVFLDRLSRSLLELNQTIEADEQQTEALRLVERNHPPESDEALAALYKYAAWLRDRGFFQDEREQYLRALRTVREHYGKEDVRQVAPLVGLANSLRNQRLPDGLGISSLQEALRFLQAAPEQDRVAIAAVMRDIGDWFVAFNRVGYDGTEYRHAWELLGSAPNGEQLRQEWFTGPTYVLREPISLRSLSEEPDAPQGHVLVSFDLGTTGESTNVAIVESTPAGLKDEAMLRHIRRSRFRPQMANGELVPGQGLALQFNFRYMPDAVATND